MLADAHDLEVLAGHLEGAADVAHRPVEPELHPHQVPVALDGADLGDAGEPAADCLFGVVSFGSGGQADPGDVAAVGLGPEEGQARRIRAAPREAGQHVEQDSTDRLIAVGQGQVPRDPAHGWFPCCARFGRTLLSIKILECWESFKAAEAPVDGRDPSIGLLVVKRMPGVFPVGFRHSWAATMVTDLACGAAGLRVRPFTTDRWYP